MTNAAHAGRSESAGGRGRLAEMIATRGGTAAPEAPFVIEHREALIYMLCEAAELEHGIMCQYLFAAFTLKQSTDEGLTEEQLAAVNRWRKQVLHVATQEMLHLALVQNLLTAIGGPPHLVRPNLPQPAGHYPAGVQLALLPFGEQAVRHFMFLERPEHMDLEDADGMGAVGRAEPLMSEGDIVPRGQDFATVGHLYRSIEAGFAHLAEKYGEDWLFVGPPRAQATPGHFRWTDLVTVTDLASAQRAINTILEQGEGPRGNWRNAHFGQFVNILDEYLQLTETAGPGFNPVRPVIAANVRPPQREADVPLITDPLTARICDLFNVGYEILLQVFARYFAHTQETDAQLKALADATISLMAAVLQPLANVITTLPAGPGHEGKNAGPSFELFYEADYLLPHRDAAWALLTERLEAAASFCVSVAGDCHPPLAQRLAPITSALEEIAQALGAHLPAGRSHAGPAGPATAALAAQLERAGGLIRRARQARGSDTLGGPHGLDQLAELTDAARRAVRDGAPSDQPLAELLWAAAQSATGLRVRAGQARVAAPELAEATAVLQRLACDLALPDKRAGRREELWRAQSGLAPGIQTARNGPYLATNIRLLRNHLGEHIPAPPQVALCRCGGSAAKPFCDGNCAGNGFTDAKDPKRVPDRLDTYPGVRVTVRDNRGICQHSGLCTNRLATAFRAGQEPFVAPSGARADEMISTVRDCPSGALSFVLDGQDERGPEDRGNAREPAIEVTKDGPYRVTGGIALSEADGTDVARNSGSSREHYAICRCGHSQNKPFCSGMHWYADFRDPPVDPQREPTIFEWAGGLPALSRLTRIFYEQHVPGDPILAPLFASMPPALPQRMAVWLGEVFGGPAAAEAGAASPAGPDGGQADGYPQMLARLVGEGLNDEQQGRWVSLLCQAARDAGLPADPQFRAMLGSFAQWHAGTATQDGAPVPRWDWGPGGAPSVEVPPAAEEAGKPVTLPEPGQPVSFAAHVKPMFRPRDRDSMRFALDLWSYQDVQAHAGDILDRLREGSMPCDGAWPKEQVEVFARWTTTQMQP